ncbi:Transcriptional regulator of acetoin/glycerol metabolism [Clostridium frigidicarnis]|uniref:Transcriptional regulator of acetoin/glycerol metabolism n=1 Tax=Clostridium frigidicarnis TaxID=84698 RepID=A0A1I0ZQ51_9CLOT|nr:Transcriptional regulator of acetoin/glycerol metabolism [Clostridium frigidicarnis]
MGIGEVIVDGYMNFIAEAWETFINTGHVHKNVRKDIADSWIRCRQYGVNPMNGKGSNKHPFIDKLIGRNSELISVSKPIMEGLYNIVKGSGFAIILSDKDGYIIEVIGDESIMERVNELNFLKGELWTEEAVGTNAVGTALYLDKPIQTIGAEHFGINQHSWTCSACPIHDEDGKIIGCINMSGNYYDAHSHTLGIVTAAAQSIQKQLALTISYNLLNITFDSISEGMIVLDERLKVKRVNGRGLEILGITLEETINLEMNKVLLSLNLNNMIDEKFKIVNNLECDFNIKNSRIKCLINAVPMNVNEKNIGIVITFREVKHVHKLVNKLVGYKASYTFDDIITINDKMKDLIFFGKKAAKSDCNILIEGESGTGKELIAQSIHNFSNRKKGPFVAVNCASIPRELVESELFGYEKGAFTGASKEGHPGKFELADGGTIFLDEIGELPLDIQSKLLRVLDNGKLIRIGGTFEKQLDVRVIGATNRVLKSEILKRNFREDLYYRLSVMNIKTIPLRERKEDIEVLVNQFIKSLSLKDGKFVKDIDKNYIEQLKKSKWQGNVRELRNVVERDYYLSEDKMIYIHEEGSNIKLDINDKINESNIEFTETVSLDKLEKQAIEAAIKKSNGNMVKAAELLNIGRATLYRKIKKYNINN